MRQPGTFRSVLVALFTVLLAGFAAPPGHGASVDGSYRFDWSSFGYVGRETVSVDARIVDGAPAGNVVRRGWSRPQFGRYRSNYRIEYLVVSLTIIGNEAWIVARDVKGFQPDWVAHIVDNGAHGDTVNGQAIDGNFRVRE